MSISLKDLKNKTVVMTGATDGIGLVAARKLIEAQTQLSIIARDEAKARKLYGEAIDRGSVRLFQADLASLGDIQRVVREAQSLGSIDVLINNAGVMKNKLALSHDGFEMSVAVNHLAVAALTQGLLPLIQATKSGARIVNVNSEGHRAALQGGSDITPAIETWRGADPHYAFSVAYSRSKLANLLWTYALAEQLKPQGITVNALHPGSVRTQLGRELSRFITEPYHLVFSINVEKGAASVLHLAASPALAQVTGAYFDRFTQVRSSSRSYDPRFQREVWEETARIIAPVMPAV